MNASDYISKNEHRLLLILAFIAFAFLSLTLTSQIVKSYNYSAGETQTELKNKVDGESNASFSGIDGTPSVPGLHVLTLFIFLALLKSKRFFLPAFLTVFYTFVFIYGLALRYDAARLGGEEFSPKVNFLVKVHRAAETFDYIAAIFISILLFWQISILLRILIKTLQRTNELP